MKETEKQKILLPGISDITALKTVNDRNKVIIALTLLWVISFSSFEWLGNSIFFFQAERTLFVSSKEYFWDHLSKPGGLLEYAGCFLTVWYHYPAIGSAIISSAVMCFGVLLINISGHLKADRSSSLFLTLLPALFLLLLQKKHGHFMHFNLGILAVTSFFLFYLKAKPVKLKLPVLSLFPLLFHVTGAFALLFPGIHIVYSLVYEKNNKKYFTMAYLVIVMLATLVVSGELLFLQTVRHLLTYPVIFNKLLSPDVSFYLFCGFYVFFPCYIAVIDRIKPGYLNQGQGYITATGMAFFLVVLLLGTWNNEFERMIKMEKAMKNRDWQSIVEQHEENPSKNLTGQYYYNLALSNLGQLCDRLFRGEQDYGTKSLYLPHDDRHIDPAIYFYYTIGLINQAHHLAYESMVRFGYHPENIKMLVKTNLINGNYRLAERYIAIMENTFRYKTWAGKYREMLTDTCLIASDPELGEKIRLQPVKDFFVRSDDAQNIELMIISNPGNEVVFEYKLARLLYEKDYVTLTYLVKYMKKMGYDRMPRYVEEAVMVFFSERNELPDLGGFKISRETENAWMEYNRMLDLYSNEDASDVSAKLKVKWGKSFWYYLHFK